MFSLYVSYKKLQLHTDVATQCKINHYKNKFTTAKAQITNQYDPGT